MTRRRVLIVVAATAVTLSGASLPAWAYFTASATSTVTASAATLAAPQTATATPASTSSMTIAVTAKPATGPTPTAYRVDRTSMTAPGQKLGACTIAAVNGTGSCTDTGLIAGTAYSYAIYSLIGSQWVSSGSATASNTTTAISTPTISSPTSAHPQSVKAGKSLTFNITGTNFASGVYVSLASGSASVYSITAQSYTNATTISVTVANGSGNNGTSYNAGLTVTNPDGGTATSANCISN